MDRRTFLGVAASGAALLWLPRSWLLRVPPGLVMPELEQDLDEQLDEVPVQRLLGATYANSLTLLTISKDARVHIYLPDEDKPHVTLAADVDGVNRWVAAPGEELYGPLRIATAGRVMSATLYGRRNGGLDWSTWHEGQALGQFVADPNPLNPNRWVGSCEGSARLARASSSA